MPDEQNPDDDKFRPDAIAARVDRLGEETDLDRTAREEEQKLLLRRKEQKKSGLETAASKRLSRIGEAKVKRPVEAVAQSAPGGDIAGAVARWVQDHRTAFATTVGLVAVVGASALGWTAWQDKQAGLASTLLAEALSDEHGHVSAKDPDDEDDSKARALYPTFKSAGEKRDAALAKFRAVESKYPGSGPAILARLEEAAILLDAGDAKGAKQAYADVTASPLARADGDVRGRALEGSGFADELLAESDAANKDQHLRDALAAFKSLEGVSVDGFKELGMYHQSRVLLAQGEREKAIELLKDVQKRVSEPGDDHPFAYLQFVAEDRLRELDPTALPPKAPKPSPAAAGGAKIDMNDARVKDLLKQLQQQGQQGKTHGGAAP